MFLGVVSWVEYAKLYVAKEVMRSSKFVLANATSRASFTREVANCIVRDPVPEVVVALTWFM